MSLCLQYFFKKYNRHRMLTQRAFIKNNLIKPAEQADEIVFQVYPHYDADTLAELCSLCIKTSN